MQRTFISNNIALTKAPEGEILDVYVMEQIGADWWNGNGITKQNILNEIKSRAVKSINLSISSPGGDVDEALAIKDMLLGTGAPITAEVSGLTASAATIIMMAAGKIKMSSDAFLLIHNTSTTAEGNKDDFRKTANELEKFDQALANLYHKKTGKGLHDIRSRMNADSWMNAEEALAFGIVDEIIERKPVAAKTMDAIRNMVNNSLLQLPQGYLLQPAAPTSNVLLDFLYALREEGLQITGSKSFSNNEIENKVKDLTNRFIRAAQQDPQPDTTQPAGTADYSVTLTDAVESIELADGTAVELPNAPYEPDKEGASALQEDLAAAITADSVIVTFSDADLSLTIEVSGSRDELATVNGTDAFKQSGGDKGATPAAKNLRREIETLKRKKAAALNDTAEVRKLRAEKHALENELKQIKLGKSGGRTAGSLIEDAEPETETQGNQFVRKMFRSYLNGR